MIIIFFSFCCDLVMF